MNRYLVAILATILSNIAFAGGGVSGHIVQQREKETASRNESKESAARTHTNCISFDRSYPNCSKVWGEGPFSVEALNALQTACREDECTEFRRRDRMNNHPDRLYLIPKEQMVATLREATKSQKTVISVGSGTGRHEKYLSEQVSDLKWFLVDPAPTQWEGAAPVMAPDYPFLTDLLKAHPEVAGNSTLLMIWPFPGNNVNPAYDLESILALQPTNVVILYEKPMHKLKNGSLAGSVALWQAIDELALNKKGPLENYRIESTFNGLMMLPLISYERSPTLIHLVKK